MPRVVLSDSESEAGVVPLWAEELRPEIELGERYSERQVDPTPEEIRAMCLEIQAGWSEEERRLRLLGNVPGTNRLPGVKELRDPWSPPELRVAAMR